jgi:TolA-binding protein
MKKRTPMERATELTGEQRNLMLAEILVELQMDLIRRVLVKGNKPVIEVLQELQEEINQLKDRIRELEQQLEGKAGTGEQDAEGKDKAGR